MKAFIPIKSFPSAFTLMELLVFIAIIDYPVSYHNAARGVSLADGHSEIKNGSIPGPCPS